MLPLTIPAGFAVWRRRLRRSPLRCLNDGPMPIGHNVCEIQEGNEGTMAAVARTDEAIEVEAAIVARAMRFAVEYFLRQLRNGRIRTLVERGSGDDEGRHRLTFRTSDRLLTLVVDSDGAIIEERLSLRPRLLNRAATG